MTERDKMFGRIREALVVKAPFPGHAGAPVRASAASPTGRAAQWLPATGDSFEERLARFQANAAALRADFHLAGNRDEAVKLLLEIRDAQGWKAIATHQGELTDFAAEALSLPMLRTDSTYDAKALDKCDAGITECDALVAQTGSVLVTNRSAGGRALSILPPHHVVLARRDQLLRDLPSAFQLLRRKYGANYPSMISFITGPSRTGDIERILVLGAHGPKKLTILCW